MNHFIYLLIIFLICGSGIGMALPSLDALITESLDKQVRGIITSIYSSMRFIGVAAGPPVIALLMKQNIFWIVSRSEEHTSELQSRGHLVCRLLLEKKK